MDEWASELAKRIGTAVQVHRKHRGWTAARLAEETSSLGFPIHRVTIGKLESGNRGAKFDVTELLVLASALNVPPVSLLFFGVPDTKTEVLPGVTLKAIDAVCWFSGEAYIGDVPMNKRGPWQLLEFARELVSARKVVGITFRDRVIAAISRASADDNAQSTRDDEGERLARLLENAHKQVDQLNARIIELGGVIDEDA